MKGSSSWSNITRIPESTYWWWAWFRWQGIEASGHLNLQNLSWIVSSLVARLSLSSHIDVSLVGSAFSHQAPSTAIS